MLTDNEATVLIHMQKFVSELKAYNYPIAGGRLAIPLRSKDDREHFFLDINQSSIKLTKFTHQCRARVSIVLLRLDIDGPPHTNPDGTEMPCPHLHIYNEEFGDKIAYPVPIESFSDLTDPEQILNDFMSYCHIVGPPDIRRDRFL